MIDREHRVNELEILIDEELVSVIARRSPVARDLRMVIALSKAVTDLERVGDEASKIARMTLELYGSSRSYPPAHERHLRDGQAGSGHVARSTGSL